MPPVLKMIFNGPTMIDFATMINTELRGAGARPDGAA